MDSSEVSQIINNISSHLMSTLDPREVLRRLMQQVISLFYAEQGSFWVVDYENKLVRFEYSLNQDGMEDVVTTAIRAYLKNPLPLGKGIVGMVAESGKPQIDNDVKADPNWNRSVDAATGFETKMLLSVPLIRGQKTIGVIQLVNRVDNQPFTPQDQGLMLNIASVAAIALENANLYDRERRQSESLEIVSNISHLLMSTLDPREVLRRLMQQVISLFYAEQGSFWVVDPENKLVRFEYSLNQDGVEDDITTYMREHLKNPLPLGTGFVGIVAETGEPLIENDVKENPNWNPSVDAATGFETKMLLSVPLIRGQKTIGVIQLVNRVDNQPFTLEDQELMLSVASAAAIALENANLYDRERRQSESLRLLNQVGETLTSGIRLPKNEIIKMLYEQSRKLTDTKNIYIALYETETTTITFDLVMEEGKQINVEEQKRWMPRRIDSKQRGKEEEIILARKPILIETKQASEDWYKISGRRNFQGSPPASWLGVPMLVGEKTIGMIALYDWEEEHAFDKFDLEVISSMASQAAIALDNSILYYDINQELEKQIKTLASLNEIGQILTSAVRLEKDEILELICNNIIKLMDANIIYIALCHQSANLVRYGLVFEKGRAKEIDGGNWTSQLAIKEVTQNIIQNKNPLFFKTAKEFKEWHIKSQNKNYDGDIPEQYTYLGAPMVANEKVLGVVGLLNFEADYAYNQDDLDVLSTIANQASIALDLKEAHQNQIKAEKEASEANISRNVAHYIKGYLGSARVQLEDALQEMERVKVNLKSCVDITEGLFAPYRFEEKQETKINLLIENAINNFEKLADIEIECNVPDNLPAVWIEPNHAIANFYELLNNAQRFVRYRLQQGEINKGKIEIIGRLNNEDEVELLFSNNGPPIPKERWEEIFEKFKSFQPDIIRTHNFGLGLWGARGFFQRQDGGYISVLESNDDRTTFVVKLPIV